MTDIEYKLSVCQMNLGSTLRSLDEAQKQLTECGYKIYRQQKEIARLHKIIKELKNGKN